MNEFLDAIPWPEFVYIGIPAFLAGLSTGWFSATRHTRGKR